MSTPNQLKKDKEALFPFNADVGLRTWIKWKRNRQWYSQHAKESIRRDILFWLNYE